MDRTNNEILNIFATMTHSQIFLLKESYFVSQNIWNRTGVMNDALGQIHSPANSDQYTHLKMVLFCPILNEKWRRTDEQHEWK